MSRSLASRQAAKSPSATRPDRHDASDQYQAPPENWTLWRDQWEYGHALHFLFDFLGFCALTWSVLSPSPTAVDGPSRRLPTYDSVSARPS